MTPEEELAEAKSAIEKLTASVTKLEAKNREVLAEKTRVASEADAAKLAAETAALEAAAKTGDVEAIKAAHAVELKRRDVEVATKSKQLEALLIDAGITTALASNNIAPEFHEPLQAMFRAQAKLDGDKALIGDLGLSEAIAAYATSDKGKHFVTAPVNSGGGATGGGGKAVQMTKETFELGAFLAIAAKNPAEANALADAIGMPELKS